LIPGDGGVEFWRRKSNKSPKYLRPVHQASINRSQVLRLWATTSPSDSNLI
jgi:hypothetical protein